MKCIRTGCEAEAKSRGLCKPHHWQWYSTGSDPTQALPSQRKESQFQPRGDAAMRRRAVEAYRDGDLSVPEIAARFGISDRTLHRWVKRAGVQRRFMWEPWTPEVVARAVALGRRGLSIAAVARELGRSNHGKVGRTLRAHGVPIRKPGRTPSTWFNRFPAYKRAAA